MPACRSCGTDNPETSKFCSECGAALAPAAAAGREERKVVTVLFADLVGSTAAADGLDPEDVRARLAPYHARVRAELERFGGTVEKFIGDAVVGLFGVPAAHEDDPERAVRAALAIQDAIVELNEADPALQLEVRIGVNTGEALVQLDADVQTGAAAASGDVMNTAARLQAAAPPGRILVAEPTWRATRDAIEYGDAEPVEAKGKAGPLGVREAIAARSRLGIDVAQHGPVELVGRRRELDVLLDALARVRDERETQLVTLVGVPGIGKSRLVFEVLAAVDAERDLVYWRQGRCLPYGEGITYWALGEMVKAQAGILETDDELRAAEKLRGSVQHAAGGDADWVERHLRALVGLAADERANRDREVEAFAAWRRFFEGLAEERPLVLVFEDLHWADDKLLDFVEYLVDWAGGVPLLVLCTARPELLERRPHWGGGKLNATTLALSPLSDDDTAQLVSALAGRALMPAGTQAQLLARAGGNPLYAEQFVRLLADGEPDVEQELPETVHGIIAARLDALPPAEKDVLQNAAVLGKVFWSGALAGSDGRRQEAEDLLHGLERKEFVRRQRRSSVEGQSEYAFRHVLVRDVAYGQIPRRLRADKHRLAAEWIESLGRPHDHAEMVAHHYASALELARAAGDDTAELAERARFAFRDAGENAARLYAHRAAASFFAAALELWPDDDERGALLLARARARVRIGEWDEHELVAARDAQLAMGHRAAAAELETMLADLARIRGEGDERDAHLEYALALTQEEPPSASQAWVLARVGWDRQFGNRPAEALELGKRALATVDSLDDDDLRAHLLNLVGSSRVALGDERGVDDLERSLAISIGANSPEALNGYNNLGVALHELGRSREAFPLQDQALELAERLGVRYRAVQSQLAKVEELYLTGRWDESLVLADRLIDAGEFDVVATIARGWRARVRLARGGFVAAREDSSQVVEFNRRAQDQRTLWEALTLDARILAGDGDRAGAAARVREVIDRWRSTGETPAGSPPIWLFDLQAALVELGGAADLLDPIAATRRSTPWFDAAAAVGRGDFRAAADTYARTGAVSEEAYARLCAARVFVGDGRRDEADSELTRALAFYRSVGARRYVAEGEVLLAASA